MPTPQFPGVPNYDPNKSVEDNVKILSDHLIGFARYMNWLMLSLDTLNINRLDAKVIIANTITAEKMNVDELSAISANLGEITAGIIRGIQIFGSYIATRDNAYPRAEMSNEGDLFGVYTSPTVYTRMSQSIMGSPGTVYSDGTTTGIIATSIFGNYLVINSDHNILLNATGTVDLDDWTKLKNRSSGQTLQQALDNLNSSISSLQSQINSLSARVSALESA
jgi:hypothetical protein